MRIDKSFFPNDQTERINRDNANNINLYLKHYEKLQDQIDHLEDRQREQTKAILKSLPYKKGTVIDVTYPNKNAGSDLLRVLNVQIKPFVGIGFIFEIIKHTKKGKERKNLRKIHMRHDELSRMDKTIMWQPND